MKKLISIALFTLIFTNIFSPAKIYAQAGCGNINIIRTDTGNINFAIPQSGTFNLSPGNYSIEFNTGQLTIVAFLVPSTLGGGSWTTNANGGFDISVNPTNESISVNGTVAQQGIGASPGVFEQVVREFSRPIGTINYIISQGATDVCTGVVQIQNGNINPCQISLTDGVSAYTQGQAVNYSGTLSGFVGTRLFVRLVDSSGSSPSQGNNPQCQFTNSSGQFSGGVTLPSGNYQNHWTLQVYEQQFGDTLCDANSQQGSILCQVTVPIEGVTAAVPSPLTGATGLVSTDICQFAGDQYNTCQECATVSHGIWTAVGCIPANPQDFVARLLQVAIGIAGGIAFLMIIYGGFQMMMSSGNPEKLNSSREIIVSAIAGLMLIVFSVVILKIIGVDVLQLPGL